MSAILHDFPNPRDWVLADSISPLTRWHHFSSAKLCSWQSQRHWSMFTIARTRGFGFRHPWSLKRLPTSSQILQLPARGQKPHTALPSWQLAYSWVGLSSLQLNSTHFLKESQVAGQMATPINKFLRAVGHCPSSTMRSCCIQMDSCDMLEKKTKEKNKREN